MVVTVTSPAAALEMQSDHTPLPHPATDEYKIIDFQKKMEFTISQRKAAKRQKPVFQRSGAPV